MHCKICGKDNWEAPVKSYPNGETTCAVCYIWWLGAVERFFNKIRGKRA